jgi:putative transposase
VPGFTINRDGETILDTTVVSILKSYRRESLFVSGGGYYKLSKYLSIEHGYYINHKKVYRLCQENNLLLFHLRDKKIRKVKKSRCEYKEITAPNQLWQFDIKYGYVHGEGRWFFILAFIDVFSKKIPGYYIGTSCKAGDLIFTLNEALRNENITPEHELNIRSDNGPQMSSNKFHFYLKRLEQKLSHEFIPPRTPNRNAYIEAFNSILEIELLSTRYFHAFKDAYQSVVKFINEYNNRRIHGSIKYLSPNRFIQKYQNGEISQFKISV